MRRKPFRIETTNSLLKLLCINWTMHGSDLWSPMRVLMLTTVLLASSALCPSFAQDQGSQSAPAKQDPQTSTDQHKGDNREVGRDWKMKPREDDRRMGMGRRGHDEGMGRMTDRMGRGMGRDRMDSDDRDGGRDSRMRSRGDEEADRYRDGRHPGGITGIGMVMAGTLTTRIGGAGARKSALNTKMATSIAGTGGNERSWNR